MRHQVSFRLSTVGLFSWGPSAWAGTLAPKLPCPFSSSGHSCCMLVHAPGTCLHPLHPRLRGAMGIRGRANDTAVVLRQCSAFDLENIRGRVLAYGNGALRLLSGIKANAPWDRRDIRERTR